MTKKELEALAESAWRTIERLGAQAARWLLTGQQRVRARLQKLDAWIVRRVLRLPTAQDRPTVPGAPAAAPRSSKTFAAKRSRQAQLLAPPIATLDEVQVEALQHDSQRRKEEARALETIRRHKETFGAFKLERLAALPRTFAPEALGRLGETHPELTTELFERLAPLLCPLSRTICDRAASQHDWDAQRTTLKNALLPKDRERMEPALEALGALALPVRREILRLPRAPLTSEVDALIPKWPALPEADIRELALAMAQFSGQELLKALNEVRAPVKIAPKGLRG